MTMPLCLEFTQSWLREKYGWKWNECGVEFESIPSYSAGQFFVSIDDAGVETGRDDTDSIMEILSINIGIWRRKEHLMNDQRGMLKLPQDFYLLGSRTIAKLERQVILPNSSNGPMYGLDKNYDYLRELNTYWQLPSAENGATFTEPFRYRGRGSMETRALTDNQGNNEQIWYGYKLRFRGLKREQIIHRSGYALG
jgi:hypothetical protein